MCISQGNLLCTQLHFSRTPTEKNANALAKPFVMLQNVTCVRVHVLLFIFYWGKECLFLYGSLLYRVSLLYLDVNV